MEPAPLDLMTLQEVSELLRTSRTSVLRWANEGRIPAIRFGPRTIRFRRSDVEALLTPTTPAEAAQ